MEHSIQAWGRWAARTPSSALKDTSGDLNANFYVLWGGNFFWGLWDLVEDNSLQKHFWAHLCVCMVGSYASYCVCMSVTWPKFRLEVKSLDLISQEPITWGSWTLVRTWTWMALRSILRVRVIGQRSRSPGQNSSFQVSFYSFTGNGTRVKGAPVQGQRSFSLKCVESACNSPYDVIKRQVGSHQRQVAFFL